MSFSSPGPPNPGGELDALFSDVPSHQGGSPPRSGLHRHPILGLVSFLCLHSTFVLIMALMGFRVVYVPSIAHEIQALVAFNLVVFVSTASLYRYLYMYQRQELFRGYLGFYHKINRILPLPFYAASASSCCISLAILLSGYSAILLFLRIALLVEYALVLGLVSWYVFLTVSHSMDASLPDAYKELSSVLRESIPQLLDANRANNSSLFERQTSLLRFQNAQLRRLSMEIIKLRQNVPYDQGRESNVWRRISSDERVSNDEEMDALNAEIEKLEEELRYSRSLISEQKSEIEELKNVNQKYCDENERLRLNLEEWSAFNARLQIALDSEQKMNAELRQQALFGTSQSG